MKERQVQPKVLVRASKKEFEKWWVMFEWGERIFFLQLVLSIHNSIVICKFPFCFVLNAFTYTLSRCCWAHITLAALSYIFMPSFLCCLAKRSPHLLLGIGVYICNEYCMTFGILAHCVQLANGYTIHLYWTNGKEWAVVIR